MIVRSWKNGFSLRVFSLKHSNPKIFITSQWQRDKTKPSIIYLLYRSAIALFLCTTWALSVSDFKKTNLTAAFRAKYLVYLTNWGYTMCTLQALLSFLMLALALLSQRLKSHPKLETGILKLYKVYRLVNVIATPVAFGITAMYWSLIYDSSTATFDEMNFFVHGCNSICMFIDLFMVAHPVDVMHFIYPGIFGIIYATFSLIYYLCGGTSREGTVYIYTILNWEHPGKTVAICLGVLLFLVILHMLTWGLHLLRRMKEKPEPIIDQTTGDNGKGYVNEGMANDVV